MVNLKYLNHYPKHLLEQVQGLIKDEKLSTFILSKYPQKHRLQTDKALYDFTIEMKNMHMKKSPPLSKVLYDGKINIIAQALGTHTFISRVQGGKLKAKNEIRVASSFKSMPELFLRMIVVHELAHFKEKEHNKAFYKLCTHMEADYHQLEFDTRLYLTHVDLYGKLY
ncbi:MAG TPA: M48 family peptidase [Campylobacterales bacterium]|nr:M48 family peptidase [Campylobacterales bacterium]